MTPRLATQQDNTHHNIQYNITLLYCKIATLSTIYKQNVTIFKVMLSVIQLNDVMLNVVAPRVQPVKVERRAVKNEVGEGDGGRRRRRRISNIVVIKSFFYSSLTVKKI
jgi:hypothetical protein